MLKTRLLLVLFTLFVLAWVYSAWTGEQMLFMSIAMIVASCVGVYLSILTILRADAHRKAWLSMVASMTAACACVGVLMAQPWLGLMLCFMVSVFLTSLVLGMVQKQDDEELLTTLLNGDHSTENA